MVAVLENVRHEHQMAEQLGYVGASIVPWGALPSTATGRITYKIPNVTVLANCFRREPYFLSEREQNAIREALWSSVEVLHQE